MFDIALNKIIMKRILVATDHSAPADNAMNYAANIAKQMNAEIVLFSVYKMSIHAGNAMASLENIDKLKKVSEERLEEAARELSQRYKIPVSWKLGVNGTIEALNAMTDDSPVDLVVMGIESDLTEYKMFGNTTTDAIKLRKFPILVVPNDYKYDGIQRIMYACEASYIKDGCTLDVLKNITRAYDAELDVLHVLDANSKMSGDIQLEFIVDQVLNDVAHEYKYVQNTKVGEGIAEALKTYPSDLLVMVPHKIGFFESLIKGSQTNHMTVRTRIPLLVIPNLKAG